MIKSGLLIKFLFLPDGEDPDTLVKKESTATFEKRIETAQALSKFLFAHIQAEVDFSTIEGKTSFLEKVLLLIALVAYDTYQQQLLEGVAEVVGQSIEQVKSVFVKQVEKAQIQAPVAIEHGAPMPDFTEEDYKYSIEFNATPKANKSAIALMAKMISLLLNYPSLATGTVEERVHHIDKSEVLLELVRSAEIDENISQQDLIEPFKSKLGVYQRLQELCVLTPYLSEDQAKDEFLSALTAAERHQQSARVKCLISNADTEKAQRKIMEGIQKSKGKK
jgi:DNA primase